MENECERRLLGLGRVNCWWLGKRGFGGCLKSQSVPLVHGGVVPAHFSKFITCPFSVLQLCFLGFLTKHFPPFAWKPFPFLRCCSEATLLWNFTSQAGLVPLSRVPAVLTSENTASFVDMSFTPCGLTAC